MADPTAASKLKMLAPVPADPPTVTSTKPGYSLMLLVWHCIAVEETHDDVTQGMLLKAAVAVCSATPKLSPLTVTDP